MAINRFITTTEILKRVAAEVGLDPSADPFSTDDAAFVQMRYLLTASIQDLMTEFPWQILTRQFQYSTGVDEVGDIDLPTDFGYMIPQTGWERSENVPLLGPLSAQDWTYLLGRDLVSSTIYASFRFDQNKLRIFPNDPMPEGLDINFEYISRNLLLNTDVQPNTYSDAVENGGQVVLFPPNLITRLLKKRQLEAKGMDSSMATNEYLTALDQWKGNDNSAAILNAGSYRHWYPMLDAYRNTPDTGFGRT